ncbi:hypothetical protein [Pseudomonas sp. BGI-2]|uniref:hypothetical protein n=1 Tax=Pseudomonas sp. BGI-2 TaxID=2528211 RepID=UPI0015B2BE17|nr:hypothetical protein [Pseudomonas sp. BGI-2]
MNDSKQSPTIESVETVSVPRAILEKYLGAGDHYAGEWVKAGQELRAILTKPNEVPAGWKVVPVEPTDEMIRAVAKYDREFFQPSWKGAWREFLNAAPVYSLPKTSSMKQSRSPTFFPYGTTVKLRYATDESCIGWAHRGENGELLSACGRVPLDPETWFVVEELTAPDIAHGGA